MDLIKAKEINEFILNKASEKIESTVKKGSWDNEEFSVMSEAIENLVRLEKLGKKEKKEEVEKIRALKKDAYTEETEFESLMYRIQEEKNDTETMICITTIIADHMEDIRIMQPRAYDIIMMKLREVLN